MKEEHTEMRKCAVQKMWKESKKTSIFCPVKDGKKDNRRK
jgi:hypothetical protein